MIALDFRRLGPAPDFGEFESVLRGAPSLVFATQGRTPTDADAAAMAEKSLDPPWAGESSSA